MSDEPIGPASPGPPPIKSEQDWKAPPPASQPHNDPLHRLIPVSNPDSLWAYYMGLATIIPLCFFFTGPFAIYKGIRACSAIKENPGLPGRIHAWIGIVFAATFTFLWAAIFALVGYAFATRPR